MNAITKMDGIRPALDELVPSRYAVQIGDIDVLVISDGVVTPPAESMATNADPAVRVVADSDLAAALAQETETPPTWQYFSDVFDGARTLTRISLPVYSPDGNRAVVYTTSTGPYSRGAGFYHELAKSNGRWTITRSLNAWLP